MHRSAPLPSEAGAAQRSTPAAAWPSAVVAACSIVLVDDEPLSSDALTHFLQGFGYGQITHLPGHLARPDTLRDLQPGVVLLDMELDAGRSMQVLAMLKADRMLRHVPVMGLSANADRPVRLTALQAGVADFLVKPVDGAELEFRLRNILTAKLQRDELAHTDALTGLPNRDAMLWRLDWAIKHAMRHKTVGAVLQVGLDRFEQINDALGPAVSDELLHALSQRLVQDLRDGDLVARRAAADPKVGTPPSPSASPSDHPPIEAPAEPSESERTLLARGNGAEFTVLLPHVARAEDAAVVARRLVRRIADVFEVGGHELFVGCRIGIAVFPVDSSDKDTILKQAGAAMRHARSEHGVSGAEFQFYSDRLNSQSLKRLGIERELRRALEHDELRVFLQPQVDLRTGQLYGAEALARWQHPERGLLGPYEFIPVAEQTGLIGKVGAWMIRSAVRQLAAWQSRKLALGHVSVNVSRLQLQSPRFGDEVADLLTKAGIEGRRLCLEITESAVIDSGEQVARNLAQLREFGVQIALDDFGTGYSSLTYLRQIRIDELKIDRSFVANCWRDKRLAAITDAILLIARGLDLRFVDGGVETTQELEFLRARRADAFQGYLFSKPIPVAEFEALLVDQTEDTVMAPFGA
jgi:diguanylate cyclase